MLIATLLILAGLTALFAAVAAVYYQFCCSSLEAHLRAERPDYATAREAFTIWREKRWALDKVRLRVGLAGIGCYGVGMAALIPVQNAYRIAENSSHLPMVFMVMLSVALVAVALRSMLHNDRLFEIDMKRQFPDLPQI